MKVLKLAVLALALSLMSIGSAFAHGSSVRIGINLGNPIVSHRYVPSYWGHHRTPRVYYSTPRVYYNSAPVIYYSRPIRHQSYRHHYRDRGDRYFGRSDRKYYRQHRDRGRDRGRFNGRANNDRRGWR